MPSLRRGPRKIQKATEKVARRVSKQEKKTANTLAKGTQKIEKMFSKMETKAAKSARSPKVFEKYAKNKKKQEKQALKSVNKKPLPRASTSGRAGGRIVGGLGSGPFGPRVR